MRTAFSLIAVLLLLSITEYSRAQDDASSTTSSPESLTTAGSLLEHDPPKITGSSEQAPHGGHVTSNKDESSGVPTGSSVQHAPPKPSSKTTPKPSAKPSTKPTPGSGTKKTTTAKTFDDEDDENHDPEEKKPKKSNFFIKSKQKGNHSGMFCMIACELWYSQSLFFGGQNSTRQR